MIFVLTFAFLCTGATAGFTLCAVLTVGACDRDCERARGEGFEAGEACGYQKELHAARSAGLDRPVGQRLAVVGGTAVRP